MHKISPTTSDQKEYSERTRCTTVAVASLTAEVTLLVAMLSFIENDPTAPVAPMAIPGAPPTTAPAMRVPLERERLLTLPGVRPRCQSRWRQLSRRARMRAHARLTSDGLCPSPTSTAMRLASNARQRWKQRLLGATLERRSCQASEI